MSGVEGDSSDVNFPSTVSRQKARSVPPQTKEELLGTESTVYQVSTQIVLIHLIVSPKFDWLTTANDNN